MNIAFVSSSISRSGGGVSEVKRRLAQNLAALPDVQIEVVGLEDEYATTDFQLWQPFKPQLHKVTGPGAIGFSTGLLSALKKSDADLIHLHGLWQYPSFAAARSGKPYLTTIHGMLDRWAVNNSKIKKQIASFLYERAALQKANCLQAFTRQELQDIRNFGLKNPVCIIPNGVDLPGSLSQLKAQDPVWKGVVEPGKKVMLYLGRIHPKKGLVNLIHAWKKLQEQGKNNARDWALVIAGWNQGNFEQELKDLTETSGLTGSIHFLGPQFGVQKELVFAHAHGFILPSFSEGLPMAVLEAWSYSLPVIMTPQCNLPEGFDKGAAICIQPAVDSIFEALYLFTSEQPIYQEKMGAAGFQLVAERFSWQSIAAQIHQVYGWLLGQQEQPKELIF